MVTDLLGNQVQVAFDNTVIPHIQSGRLVGLAITGPARLSSVPDIPTAAEAGLKGYEAVGWMGLMAPKGTPAVITARIAAETARATTAPEVKAKLDALGFLAHTDTPQAFADYVRSEKAKWAKVAADAGVQPECASHPRLTTLARVARRRHRCLHPRSSTSMPTSCFRT